MSLQDFLNSPYTNYNQNTMEEQPFDRNVNPYGDQYTRSFFDNSQNNLPKNKMMGKLNMAESILENINTVNDFSNTLMTSLAKPNSKASGYAEGAMNAQSLTKPLEKIPVIGQASKLISGIIGGALSARKQGIKNKEEDKQFKLTEYLNRNLMDLPQPSYYGQYMAKYGSNPKTLEQRVLDDIYSDFDKYMKLT